MNKVCKFVVGLCLSLFVLTSYAMQIHVISLKENVSAIGLKVKGEKKGHGGRCCKYEATNMNPGEYSFGIRVGGLLRGTDVGCMTRHNEKFVTVKADSTAVLAYDENTKHCAVRVVPVIRK